MSDLLQVLATYVPRFIVQKIIHNPATFNKTDVPVELFQGSVLFADVSGFTPLTEALTKAGPAGAEELTSLLNRYFSSMIAIIEAEGGQVVKFSGDAVTVLFADDAEPIGHIVRRAAQAAEAMQADMVNFETLDTSAGPASLAMKIGVAAGEVLGIAVGGNFNRWEYVIAGDPLRQVAEAEHGAKPGDIILSQEAQAVIYPHPLPPKAIPTLDWSTAQNKLTAVETAMRGFIPGAITTRLSAGLTNWLAELRRISILFIGMGGLDYNEADTVDRLKAMMLKAQEVVYRYEGSVNKLAVDDKGTILIVLFGAPPLAHEDDPARAVACALDLQEISHEYNVRLACGVATGVVFSGPVGSESRREYTVMGDTVNMSARLMQKAGANRVLTDENTYYASLTDWSFNALPPMKFKGKASLLQTYEVMGRTARLDVILEGFSKAGPIIGRDAELDIVDRIIDDASKNQGQIISLTGQAGIGKSRLTTELIGRWMLNGGVPYGSNAQTLTQHTPYSPWADLLYALFEIRNEETAVEQVTRYIKEKAPHLELRLPLLGDVMGLPIADNPTTAAFEPQLRQSSTQALIVDLIKVQSAEKPLLLVLQDAQWLDALSWELLIAVARAISNLPVLLCLAYRPLEDNALKASEKINALGHHTVIKLSALTPENTIELVCLTLKVKSLPQNLADFIISRGQGNPFYIEELTKILEESNIIEVVDEQITINGNLEQSAIPTTLEGLIRSRIDQVTDETNRFTLKVASVVGDRTFSYKTLHDVHPQHPADSNLQKQLNLLEPLDVTPLDSNNLYLDWTFRHRIVRDVSYESLLYADRRKLHRAVAEWLETDEHFDADISGLIAHHAFIGQDWKKALRYHNLAGQKAASLYAHQAAIEHFEKVLHCINQIGDDKLQPAKREAHTALGEAFTTISNYEAAHIHLTSALNLLPTDKDATEISAGLCRRLARLYDFQGDFEKAIAWTKTGLSHLKARETAEAAELMINAGLMQTRKGNFEEAKDWCRQSIAIATKMNYLPALARARNTLAIVLRVQGQPLKSLEESQVAYNLYEQLDDRVNAGKAADNMATCHFYSGDWVQADKYYREAKQAFEQTGAMYNLIMTENNLGGIAKNQGRLQEALELYQHALNAIQEIGGSRYIVGAVAMNLGATYVKTKDAQSALTYLHAGLTHFNEIGSRDFLSEVYYYMAEAALLNNDMNAAKTHAENALALAQELNMRLEEGMALRGLGRIAFVQNDLSVAEAYLSQSLDILTESKNDYEAAQTMVLLAEVKAHTNLEAQNALLDEARSIFTRLNAALDLEKIDRVIS